MFNWSGARVFGVIEALVLIMLGSYQTTVGALVEGTVLPKMSEVVALCAESLSSMFPWGFLKGFEEGECIELIEGMYYAGLYGDLYSLKLLVAFKVHGLTKEFIEV